LIGGPYRAREATNISDMALDRGKMNNMAAKFLLTFMMIASTCKGNYHIMIISTDYGSLSTITSVTVPHWLQETKLNLF
jgi:hypothetical protein